MSNCRSDSLSACCTVCLAPPLPYDYSISPVPVRARVEYRGGVIEEVTNPSGDINQAFKQRSRPVTPVLYSLLSAKSLDK